MNHLLKQAFDPDEFRREGHQLVDLLASYLEDCRDNKPMHVLPPSDPDAMVGFWTKDLNNPGFNLQHFYDTLIRQSNHIHHPHYMGHQVVPPAPLAALTELTEALLNNGMAIYEMGPSATAIERVVLRWLTARIGMTGQPDGILTSGGSAGNLTALLAARQVKCGYNIWDEGVRSGTPLAIMVSAEAHYSIARASRIMGMGEKGLVKVPVNSRMQLDTLLLDEMLTRATGQGLKVIALVGNACSTSTGTFDPLEEMADFAGKHNLWFHVDGAHGGAAAMTEKYRHLSSGIERADSVVIDFHKMMLTPALTTAVLFRNGSHSFETFAQNAAYLLEGNGQKPWFDGAGRTLECTKKMMGVKIYVMMRLYGEQLFKEYITTTFDLGQRLAEMLRQKKGFELAVQPDGNIVCFRYRPVHFLGNMNLLTATVRKKMLEDARYYVVQTSVNGQIYLRVTLMNPFTTDEHLNSMLLLVKTLAESVADTIDDKR